MAHLHFRRDVYKSGGNAASARIAYITRTEGKGLSPAERQLRYIREGREDLVYERTRNLPDWAGGDPHTYFRAAEQYEGGGEKVQWTAFEEWKITLPHELTRKQNIRLVENLIKTITGGRLPCTYAFHDPLTLSAAKHQPHIHLLISARMNDDYVRTPETHFKRWKADDHAHGGARKDPAFWHYGAVYAHRLLISDMLNLHLEVNGHAARVHPDTLESRGIDREPEPKLLPSDSDKYRKEGVVSETMAEVLRIRAARAAQPPAEQNNARAYWQERKAFLGLMRDMPLAEQVARIAALRHGTPAPTPQRAPQPTPQRVPAQRGRLASKAISAEDLDKVWTRPLMGNRLSKIYHTPEHKNYGDVNPKNQVRFRTERQAQEAGYRRAQNDHYGRGTGRARTDQGRAGHQRRHSDLATKVHRLARQLAHAEEQGHAGRLRVRLHDQEQEQGMGW